MFVCKSLILGFFWIKKYCGFGFRDFWVFVVLGRNGNLISLIIYKIGIDFGRLFSFKYI